MTDPTLGSPPAAAPSARPFAVVVLAAGSGTRMRSKLMKVLHPLCGRSMVGHVLEAVRQTEPEHVVAVVGSGREQVAPHILELVPAALLAVQETQEGTGHAVRVAVAALRAKVGTTAGTIIVTSGDTPLMRGETLAALVADHTAGARAVTVLTAEVADPSGYGRVVRDADGSVVAIVEEKEATPEEAAVREINSSVYAFDGDFLADALGRIGNDNAKGEYYLTDVVGIAHAAGLAVGAHLVEDEVQSAGANDRVQLADLAAEMNRRVLERWMSEGVTVVDPSSTWVDVTVELSPDVTIRPGVQLHGSTRVAENAVVGPDCTLTDVTIGTGATVVRTHGSESQIGAGASVGPFAYLRPGSSVGVNGKIGTFVETKNATIGDGAKVPHLSYVGDAEIGEGSNIGAGTVFANYDGAAKHRTTVGRHARTGSNNTFVAPVEVGDGAVTGGGTVVRRDVPPGALAVSGGTQRNIEGWTARKRPGTPAAEAAGQASGQPPGEAAGDTSHAEDTRVAGDGPAEGHSS